MKVNAVCTKRQRIVWVDGSLLPSATLQIVDFLARFLQDCEKMERILVGWILQKGHVAFSRG